MESSFYREIQFESIPNFRDLGGYKTREGFTVAWRKLFRSSDLCESTSQDLNALKNQLKLTAVVDLRTPSEISRQGTGLVPNSGIKYLSASFDPTYGNREAFLERVNRYTNLGEVYLFDMRQREFGQWVIKTLEIIAAPANQPLLFHCTLGKDITGVLAATILSILEVRDEDIVDDYCLTAPPVPVIYDRLINDPKRAESVRSRPSFMWEAVPKSMAMFLATIKEDYGSRAKYIIAQGAAPSLILRLKKALLT